MIKEEVAMEELNNHDSGVNALFSQMANTARSVVPKFSRVRVHFI